MYDKAEKVFISETLVDCLMYWVYLWLDWTQPSMSQPWYQRTLIQNVQVESYYRVSGWNSRYIQCETCIFRQVCK